jgi:hypothetical protein
MNVLTLIYDIIGTLISGELQTWLKQRRETKNAQAIANAPTTREELDECLEDHKF